MAKTLRSKSSYSVGPEVLIEVISDAEFIAERHKLQGAVAARVRELHRDETRLVQEVETDEHVRTMTGVDTRRTETSKTRYEWDLKTRRAPAWR